MANYLAIEWGRAGIRGLDAEIAGNAVRVRASFSSDWPEELDRPNNATAVGHWLRSQLRALGDRDRRLIVLVSGDDVVMRLLTVPEASDETMPDLVRYQTGTRSSVPLDQLALDFLPLATVPPQGGRWVQTATVPQRVLEHVKSCTDSAELELHSVGLTTVAVGKTIADAARQRALPKNGKRLIVRVIAEQLEVSLWRGTDLLFGHLAHATAAKAILSEVQRALVTHQTVAGDDEIEQAWILVPPEIESELEAALATRLGCQVTVFDPTRDIPRNVQTKENTNDMVRFAAALGALLATADDSVASLNFLEPRRRPEKRDRSKIYAAIAVGALLLMLSTAYFGTRLYLNSLEQRISEQANAIQAADDVLQQGEPTREAAAFLASWNNQQVNWLEQMQRIGAEMPGTERVYLDRWRFDRGGTELGTIEAVGFARDRQEVQQLTQRLAEKPEFRIRPNSISSAENDPEYPVLLQLNAELVARPEQSAKNLKE